RGPCLSGSGTTRLLTVGGGVAAGAACAAGVGRGGRGRRRPRRAAPPGGATGPGRAGAALRRSVGSAGVGWLAPSETVATARSKTRAAGHPLVPEGRRTVREQHLAGDRPAAGQEGCLAAKAGPEPLVPQCSARIAGQA